MTNDDSQYDAYPPVFGPNDVPVGHPGPPPVGKPQMSRRRRALVGVAGGALAAALVVTGVGIGDAMTSTSSSGIVAEAPAAGGTGNSGSSTSGSNTTQSSGTAASTSQQTGIVTVVSVLGYENAESAGTGIVLTSTGEILTNNHVVNGATSVTVTVESTGKSYRATVVGTDPTDDIAVLQLRNASGLTTARIGDSSSVAVGDAVTGVGNAGGTGTLTAASGAVTGLNKSITATDETGSDAEHLTGLIETDAGILAGDSGGPLYNASGRIVGIDTAASSTSGNQTTAAVTSTTDAYAIPIDSALKIAKKIESGVETTTIHIGLPSFLGVGIASSYTGGAGVSSVLAEGPAAEAGITAGSVITAVGGKSVTSAATLKTRLAAYGPGDRVTVTWTGINGTSHKATVTLTSGAAD